MAAKIEATKTRTASSAKRLLYDTQEAGAHAVNAAIRRAGLEGRRKTNPVVDGQLVRRAARRPQQRRRRFEGAAADEASRRRAVAARPPPLGVESPPPSSHTTSCGAARHRSSDSTSTAHAIDATTRPVRIIFLPGEKTCSGALVDALAEERRLGLDVQGDEEHAGHERAEDDGHERGLRDFQREQLRRHLGNDVERLGHHLLGHRPRRERLDGRARRPRHP